MNEGKGSSQEDVASGRHKQATETRLILGGFSILLIVGGGLTAVFMGSSIAMLATAVIGLFIGLLLLLYMGLSVLERRLRQ